MISSRFPSPLDSLASAASQPGWPAHLEGEPEIVRRVLSADPASCGLAREFTHRTLAQWNLLALNDDAALIACELVTNALRHALPGTGAAVSRSAGHGAPTSGAAASGAPTSSAATSSAAISGAALSGTAASSAAAPRSSAPAGSMTRRPPQLVLIRHPRWLLAAVTDASEQGPTVREPDYFAESGRGLHLIEALSDQWGWTPLATGGKVVWATLATMP